MCLGISVLREATAPAVLLELGYMSNSKKSVVVHSSVYQEKLVRGIVSGIFFLLLSIFSLIN
ncbi:UNVERIFIED_CONTAM: N-acetylmuramoyl-L-alanine amidase [Streptococcus canis]|nr:N-acetylmuramoyl-L-alanine amidase [Streptococcus canis]MDV6000839.1 N-acetylmuramoyl-L-alanine amidase [Streptococcus canis]MDV6021705.1 N-acetylmuramoyl-L-alanine amidase [Streptococcus canis]QKG73885.1 N-acetylmuramoyl-L-alanine amidase [Streptococcus canis]